MYIILGVLCGVVVTVLWQSVVIKSKLINVDVKLIQLTNNQTSLLNELNSQNTYNKMLATDIALIERRMGFSARIKPRKELT